MSVIISAVLPPFPKGIFSHERQRHDFPGVPLKSSLFNEFRAGSVCPLGIWVCIWGHPACAQVQGDRRKFLIPTVKISLRAILLPYYLIYDRWWTVYSVLRTLLSSTTFVPGSWSRSRSSSSGSTEKEQEKVSFLPPPFPLAVNRHARFIKKVIAMLRDLWI